MSAAARRRGRPAAGAADGLRWVALGDSFTAGLSGDERPGQS